jgi:hypothetical protein
MGNVGKTSQILTNATLASITKNINPLNLKTYLKMDSKTSTFGDVADKYRSTKLEVPHGMSYFN